jgi:hypothetical protein
MDGLQTSLASLSSVGGPVLDTELSYQLIPLQERERDTWEGTLAEEGALAEGGSNCRGGCTCKERRTC